jgi:hypothetical protein
MMVIDMFSGVATSVHNRVQFYLIVEFYNKGTKTQILIVIVTKLAENFTKNNSKYIMKFFILSLKNKKLFGL